MGSAVDSVKNYFSGSSPVSAATKAITDAAPGVLTPKIGDLLKGIDLGGIMGNAGVSQPTTADEQAQMDAETAAYNKDVLNKQAAEDADYYQQGTNGQAAPSAFSNALAGIRHGATAAYQGGLKALSTPAGMSTAAGLASGLGSMYLNNQGTKAATAGQDQSQALYQQAANANADLYRGVNDSPEQLAQRQQALQGLSERASMGLTPEDQAALQGIQRQSANQFKAANATIGQDMSRRGMANSGLGLAQSMGAADQAQQAQALAGQNQAAQSFAAKQGALNNLAQQSGNALNADYTRQIGKAQNLANVNQFNAQQQAQGAVAKGAIQQGAKAAQGQGVLDITKGAIQTLNPNK